MLPPWRLGTSSFDFGHGASFIATRAPTNLSGRLGSISAGRSSGRIDVTSLPHQHASLCARPDPELVQRSLTHRTCLLRSNAILESKVCRHHEPMPALVE